MQRRSLLSIAVALICLILAGCGTTPVAQDLTQRQANEIVALLSSRGISAVAKRESGGRGLFSVQIPDDRYATAVSLLQEHGLPSEPRTSTRELLTPQGIIPSSREMESMRLDYALASEIEEMLQSHASVAQARCVVRINFVPEGQEPSASVVVEERRAAEPLDEAGIAAIVQRAIPGVKRENLSVAISRAADKATELPSGAADSQAELVKFLWLWKVPASEYSGLALLFSAALLLVGAAAAAVGYWTCLFQRTRETVDANFPEVFPKSMRIDRVRKDLPE